MCVNVIYVYGQGSQNALTRSHMRVQTTSGLVESQEVLVRWATNLFLELTTFGCQNITNTIKDTLTFLKTCIQSHKYIQIISHVCIEFIIVLGLVEISRD